MKIFQTIICKKHWKNCANSEKAVTTSKTLKEYTIRSCTTIASNNCRLEDIRLRTLGNQGIWMKKMKSSNSSLVLLLKIKFYSYLIKNSQEATLNFHFKEKCKYSLQKIVGSKFQFQQFRFFETSFPQNDTWSETKVWEMSIPASVPKEQFSSFVFSVVFQQKIC